MNNQNMNNQDFNHFEEYSVRASIFHDFLHDPKVRVIAEPNFFTVSEGLYAFSDKLNKFKNNLKTKMNKNNFPKSNKK